MGCALTVEASYFLLMRVVLEYLRFLREFARSSCHNVAISLSLPLGVVRALESLYSQLLARTASLDVEPGFLVLGLLVLLIGLFYQSEAFERLGGPRIRGPLYSAYGTLGLPLMLVLMELQRRRGGGIFRFLGGLVLVVILIIIGVLALIAFLIYLFLRRRR